MFRRGFRTSSPAVVMASKPMYEKKATEAPAVMPPMPSVANGERCPAWKAEKPTAQKTTRMPILRIDMAAVARARSRTPRTSRVAAIRMTTTAGRLITPPSVGPAVNAPGSRSPVTLCRSSSRYSLHPTATAETETPYSRSRHQPTRKAARSPRLAYANE